MGKDTPSNQNENLGGLLGSGAATASYATGRVWTPGTIRSGGLVGQGCTGTLPDCADSYWDSVTSGLETSTSHGVRRTTAELQAPTDYSGIYASWNVDVDGDGTNDDPWDFGTSAQYPALNVDVDGNGTATWQEFGWQLRAGPTLTLTQDPVTQVNLSWTAVDVSHWNPAPTVTYTVYRLAGTTLTILSEDIGTLSYADTAITTNDTYSYQVVAEVEGGEAVRSEVLDWTVGVAGQPYPAARLRESGADTGRGAGNGGPRCGVHGSRRRHVDLRGGGERHRGALRLHRRDVAESVRARGRPRDRDRHGNGPRRPERDAGLRRHPSRRERGITISTTTT